MRVVIVGGGIGGLDAGPDAQGARASTARSTRPPRASASWASASTCCRTRFAELAELGLLPRLDAVAVRTRELIYANRFGQEIWREPRGLDAGYKVPQFSIHRGRLQGVLRDAVIERLGRKAIRTGHAFVSFAQERGRGQGALQAGDNGARTHGGGRHPGRLRRHPFDACAGSSIPGEAGLEWNGVLMWRGATNAKGFLDGRTMIVGRRLQQQAGAVSDRQGQQARHAARQLGGDLSHGRRLDPAAAARGLEPARHAGRADAARGALQHAARRSAEAGEGRAGLLRVPDGRPRSAAALDARARDAAGRCRAPDVPGGLQRREPGDPRRALPGRSRWRRASTRASALAAYEADRLPKTAEIVRNNRKGGPEGVIDEVERRAPDGFDDIDDVLSHAQREAIVKGYAQLAGFAKEQVNRDARARTRRGGADAISLSPRSAAGAGRAAGRGSGRLGNRWRLPDDGPTVGRASVAMRRRRAHTLGRRQEVDVVQGGEAGDLGRVGHLVDLLEELEQLAGRRHPEQALDRLVALVEEAVHDLHRQPDEVAGGGGRTPCRRGSGRTALQHVDELVLVGVDVRRHEGAGREQRVPGEGAFGQRLGHVGLAEDVPDRLSMPLPALVTPAFIAFMECLQLLKPRSLPMKMIGGGSLVEPPWRTA